MLLFRRVQIAASPSLPTVQRLRFSTSKTEDDTDSNADKKDDENEIELNLEQTEDNFPRLGWSPGSFGARALRPSRKRKADQAVGRSGTPAPSEDEVWFKSGIYDVYDSTKDKSEK